MTAGPHDAGRALPARGGALAHVSARHRARACNFALNKGSVLAEPAQVARLLSDLLGARLRSPADRKTFFCNSALEALHGAIKLARHYWHARGGRTLIVIHDERRALGRLFDPLGRGPREALVPGVELHDTLAAAAARATAGAAAAIVVRPAQPHDGPTPIAGPDRPLVVLDLSGLDHAAQLAALDRQPAPPDVVLWGDELAGGELPFGAFTAAPEVFAVWETLATCFVHSSTFGGNGQVLGYVRDRLIERAASPTAAAAAAAARAAAAGKREAIARHVNRARSFYDACVGFDFDVLAAEGHRLEVRTAAGEARTLFDGVGGIGCSLRGHNPPALRREVLERHDPARDYWAELAAALGELTGRAAVFPAVSGASAVEVAMTLALLARPRRSRVIVFRGNFAGKTLAALNGTAHEPDRLPFGPLYPHTTYLDAFAPDAPAALQRLLDRGDVALVWMEQAQGDSLAAVPDAILAMLSRARAEQGVLVGVDEVLHGLGRCGRLLSYDRRRLDPDFVTFSKGMSDLAVPVAATCVAQPVVEAARHQDAALVDELAHRYRYALGAHVAVSALAHLRGPGVLDRARDAAARLARELGDMTREPGLFASVKLLGLHLQLEPDLRRRPLRILGPDLAGAVVTRLLLEVGGVFTFDLRLLPPVDLDPAAVSELVARLRATHRVGSAAILGWGARLGARLVGYQIAARFAARRPGGWQRKQDGQS